MTIYALDHRIAFPNPALANPDGLLAVGGDLSVERLKFAYRIGIFPWYSKEDPILWFSPDPRFVLYPDQFKLRRSLKKTIRKGIFQVRFDTAFEDVIRACSSATRPDQDSTWITDDMIQAYIKMHKAGYAHSVETWSDNQLVGGLYGIAIGPFFFGESMFHRQQDASKVALAALVQRFKQAPFIDCQVANDFFRSMGAVDIPRRTFLKTLAKHINKPNLWHKTSGQESFLQEI